MTSNRSVRFPRALIVAAAGTLCFAGVFGATGPANAVGAGVVINASGGTATAGSGLKITYGWGQLQVHRNGGGQLYNQSSVPTAVANTNMYNSIALYAEGTWVSGTTTGSGSIPAGNAWDTVTASGGSASGSGTITSLLSKTINARLYTVAVTLSYTFPNDIFTIAYVVTIPAGAPGAVKLYHSMDSYLGGADQGPGFYSATPSATVGVAKSGVVEALRYRSGPAWTGYYERVLQLLLRELAHGGVCERQHRWQLDQERRRLHQLHQRRSDE